MRSSIYTCFAVAAVLTTSIGCSTSPPTGGPPAPPPPTDDERGEPPGAPLERPTFHVEPPAFSVERGFFDAPVSVELTSLLSTIYYTTDGSTPTPTTGIPYTGPILIETTTPLRAMAVGPGGVSTPAVTHTYIFLRDVIRQPEEPPGYPSRFAADDELGPYPADFELDPEVVEDPRYSGIIEDAFLDLPTVSIVTDIPNLFDETTGIYYNPSEVGDAWERPAGVEMFDPVDGTLFSANVGIRIHGQASRKPSWTPKRGFRVYFRTAYGPDRLKLGLFPEPGAVASFDTLVLRSIANYSWISWNAYQREHALYMRDEFARRTQLAMGNTGAHGRMVHTYVNGLYWGIYNLTERLDGDFLADYLGGESVDWDLVTMVNGVLEASEGDLVAYEEMLALANDVSSASGYEAFCQLVDVTNLIDYLILMHWVENTDWPQRNWYAARRRAEGAKFIFIAWDADTSLKSVDGDIVSVDLAGSPQGLFHQLSQNDEFRMLYADRIYAHLYNDGALSTDVATARFRELVDPLELAVTAESARWGDYIRDVYHRPDADPGVMDLYTPADHWTPTRDQMLADYFPHRTANVLGQYRAAGLYPDIEPPQFNQEGGDVPSGFTLEIDNTPNAGLGTVYYRLDGGDPREPGGAIASVALTGEDLASVPITSTTRVLARVLDGDTWSALHTATFTVADP